MKKGVNRLLFLCVSLIFLIGAVSAWSVSITDPLDGSYWPSNVTTFSWSFSGIDLTNLTAISNYVLNDNLAQPFMTNQSTVALQTYYIKEGWNDLNISVTNTTSYLEKDHIQFWVDRIEPVLDYVTPSSNLAYTNLDTLYFQFWLNETNKGDYDLGPLFKPFSLMIWDPWNNPSLPFPLGNLSSGDVTLSENYSIGASSYEGNYTYLIKAKDVYPDNTMIREVNKTGVIIRDITAPNISIDNPQDNSNNSNIILMDISAYDVINTTPDISGLDYLTFNITNGTLVYSNNSNSSPINYNWNSSAVADGYYNITAMSYDRAGNPSGVALITINVDNTAPLIFFNSPAAGIYNSTQLVNITAIDLGNHLFGIYMNVNGSWVNSTSGSELLYTLGEGNYTVYGTANDTLENENQTGIRNILVDLTAPVTTDDSTGIWYNTNVIVTLSPTDNLAGINATYYCTDQNNTCIPGTSGTSVNVTAEGINYVRYYSTDNAGNIELIKNATVKIDLTDPVTTDDAPSGWQGAYFNVTLNATDGNLSGVYYINYSYNNGPWQQVFGNSTSVLINQEGNLTLRYYAVDNAGNVEGTNTVYVALDTVYPLIEFTTGTELDNSFVSQNWIFANVSVTEVNEDTITFDLYNSSGLVNSTSSIVGARTINWTGLADGIYYYNVTVNDSVGNTNYTETRMITLDTIAPTLVINSPINNSLYNNATQLVNITSNDANPDSVWYSINGGANITYSSEIL